MLGIQFMEYFRWNYNNKQIKLTKIIIKECKIVIEFSAKYLTLIRSKENFKIFKCSTINNPRIF